MVSDKQSISGTASYESYGVGGHIIRAGAVQLNQISPYLEDMKNEATGKMLVVREKLEDIDGFRPGNWIASIARISRIENYAGLGGMQIVHSPDSNPDLIYEKHVQKTLDTLSTELNLAVKQ